MTRMSPDILPESLLPLQPAVFHILMALADEDRHGYAIIQEVLSRTTARSGSVRARSIARSSACSTTT